MLNATHSYRFFVRVKRLMEINLQSNNLLNDLTLARASFLEDQSTCLVAVSVAA